ncbi:catalase domain-containing protein [Ditylenchus destructor]|uniref:Catalase n=1 Tax=Ditylenchus destructor TaxID=166010 RepID=A0AAD4QVK3_9BILA|nr:catalase domain-containing protein [Ditylenchus destructor]
MAKKPAPSPATDHALRDHQPGERQITPDDSQGNGDELHQDVDNQNSLRAGTRGPTLLEDFVLREKIFHFDHERIPERIVHARGSGAHGVFQCTQNDSRADEGVDSAKGGGDLPVFVRFSTVAGGAGSVDTPRDVRGFAVKLYTDSGNWDLVGNNIPVFFFQDAMKFPDLVHSVKMEADRGYPQAASAHDTFWDFIGLMPEAMHMIMWAMSRPHYPAKPAHDRRASSSNSTGSRLLGIQSTTWDEAVKIAGADPDFHRRDLFEAIDAGDFPAWDLGVQVFDEAFAAKQPYDVLDATKLIPEEDIPVEIVGRMTLNRNVDNFFAETEQVAFLPAGSFSHLDTQKSRLGTTNFHQIPINAPKCPFHNFQRDGMMQTLVPTGRANYEPNSLAEAGENGGPRASAETGFKTFETNDERNDLAQKLRIRAELFADHFSQARLFYLSQTENEQAHIASALVFELSKVTLDHVRARVVGQLRNIDEDLAKRVAAGLAIDLPAKEKAARAPVDLKPSDALSIQKNADDTMEGRKVAILFAEGSDKAAIDRLKGTIESAGGTAFLVAPKVGGIKVKGGTLKADGQLAGSPSVLFDAVASILTDEQVKLLSSQGAAVQWFMDAYGHCKTIAHDEATQLLLDKAGVEKDSGIVAIDKFADVGTRRHWAREAKVRDLA